MADTPFLRVVGTAEALELAAPSREESLAYQAKLLGLWEQQQRVLGALATWVIRSRKMQFRNFLICALFHKNPDF